MDLVTRTILKTSRPPNLAYKLSDRFLENCKQLLSDRSLQTRAEYQNFEDGRCRKITSFNGTKADEGARASNAILGDDRSFDIFTWILFGIKHRGAICRVEAKQGCAVPHVEVWQEQMLWQCNFRWHWYAANIATDRTRYGHFSERLSRTVQLGYLLVSSVVGISQVGIRYFDDVSSVQSSFTVVTW